MGKKTISIEKGTEVARLKDFVDNLPLNLTSVKVKPWSDLCLAHGLNKIFIGRIFNKLQEVGVVEVVGSKGGIRYRKIREIQTWEATIVVDAFHMMPGNAGVSLLGKERKTVLKDVKEPKITEHPVKNKVVPTLGNKCYFINENLIGYGILKTIEALFNDEESIIGYRYEVRTSGKSFVVDDVFEDITDALVKIK